MSDFTEILLWLTPAVTSDDFTQERSERGGCGGATPPPPPPTEMTRKKSGKIKKQSGKKSGKIYAKMREIRDIAIRKINKIK